MRRVARCEICGEERELATKAPARCFMCYRREERARARRVDRPIIDRHNPGPRREQKRLIRAFGLVMSGLADLAVSRHDLLAIRELLKPYLLPVTPFLAGHEDTDRSGVNSEQRIVGVHCSRDALASTRPTR